MKLLDSDTKIERKDRKGNIYKLQSAKEIKKQWGIEFKEARNFQAGELISPQFEFDKKEPGK